MSDATARPLKVGDYICFLFSESRRGWGVGAYRGARRLVTWIGVRPHIDSRARVEYPGEGFDWLDRIHETYEHEDGTPIEPSSRPLKRGDVVRKVMGKVPRTVIDMEAGCTGLPIVVFDKGYPARLERVHLAYVHFDGRPITPVDLVSTHWPEYVANFRKERKAPPEQRSRARVVFDETAEVIAFVTLKSEGRPDRYAEVSELAWTRDERGWRTAAETRVAAAKRLLRL